MKTKFVKPALLAGALSLFGCLTAAAQDFSGEITAGVNFSGYKYEDLIYEDLIKAKGTGFRVGAIGEMGIPKVKGLYANAGILISLSYIF